jgi:DNA-binding NtrC family response regulator
MCNSSRVMLKHLPGYLTGGGGLAAPRLGLHDTANDEQGSPESSTPSDLNLEKMERSHIPEALRRTGNNRTTAAGLLGISRRTLHRKLAEMDILIRRRSAD